MHVVRRFIILVGCLSLVLLATPASFAQASASPSATPSPQPAPGSAPTISPAPSNSAPPATEGTDLSAELPPRTVLLICRFDPSSIFNPSQRQLLFESLATRLGASNPDILIRQYPDMSLPPDTDLNQIAINLGIDAWVSVRVTGSMAKANFRFHGYDLQTMSDYFEMELSAGIDSRFRNAFGGLWMEVEKKIAATIHKNRQINSITFTGPVNTIISVDKDQTIGPEGSIGFNLPTPANYKWHAYLPGYHYSDGSFFLDESKNVALEFKPYSKVHFEIGLEWLSFPVIRFLYQAIPDTWDIDFSMIFYTFGIAPSGPRDGSSALIHDYHLINALLGMRWYPLMHRYYLRPWFGAGLQLRVSTNDIAGYDTLSPWGFYLQFGTSIDLSPGLALVLELTPRITVTKNSQLALNSLAASGGTNSGFNQMVPAGDNIIIEPWHFSVGIRIQP